MKKTLLTSIIVLLCTMTCVVSASAQIDYTNHISNPSFEDGTINGWSWYGYNPENAEGERDVTANISPSSAVAPGGVTMSNTDGERVCDFYMWAWTGWWSYYSVYQTVTSLPAGDYELSAIVSSHADRTVTLFAGTPSSVMNDANSSIYRNSTTVTTQDRSIGQPVSLRFTLTEQQDVTIGAGLINVPSWWEVFFKVDNFRLTYYPEALIQTKAIEMPGSSTQLSADTWYYYDVPADGNYTFSSASLSSFVYTDNGNQATSGTISSSALPSSLSLTEGQRIYLKTAVVSSLSITVPSSLNHTGTTVSTGDFYIFNLGSGKYLNQGSSYGTHTTVDGAGQSITISGTTDAYQLHFSKVAGDAYLGNGGWVDCSPTREDYSTWTFEPINQAGFNNVYKLKANKGGNYLYWNGGRDDYGDEAIVGDASGRGDAAYWILIPKTTREGYNLASESHPVDMTWKMVNPDFQGNVTEILAGKDTNGNDIKWYAPNEWTCHNFYAQSNNAEATVSRFVENWMGYWNYSSDVGTFTQERGTYDALEDRYYLNDSEIYQTVGGLPAGKYSLSFSAKAEQQADNTIAITGVQFYAGSKKLAITSSQAQSYAIEFVTDGSSNVKIGCEVTGTNANWVYFDNVRLTYYGSIAEPLPNDNTTELAVGQWYYYDAPTFGQYQLEGPVANIVYTQNGDNLADDPPTTKTAQTTLILESGRIYFQATAAGTTLKINSISDEGINTTFTIASLNVDGLPTVNFGSIHVNPEGRGSEGAKDISKYLMMEGKRYDLIAVQEDFNYNGSLVSEFGDTYGQGTWRGDVDILSVISSFLGNPEDTDGLNFFWNKETGREGGSESWTRYTTSVATEGNNYIQKGFRRYEGVNIVDGLKVDVYITHMDAGDMENGATTSRNAQWTQLANAIIADSHTTRPKIVLGDFNSRYTREDIIANFIHPIEEAGNFTVKDVWIEMQRGGNYPSVGDNSLSSEVVDKIFYLNPKAPGSAQLTPLTYARETDYTVGTVYGTSDNTPLGDHGPIVVKFKAEKPALQFSEIKDRWQWTGETITYGSVSWFLYNVHWGSYDSGKAGFLTSNGTLVRDPNLSSVHEFAFYGDGSGASISNNYNKLKVWYSNADYKAGLISSSESGATTFKVFDTNDSESSTEYAGELNLAYHFKGTGTTANNHFFGANSATELDAHANPGTHSAWALISDEQRAEYNRYCSAWDKGYTYLMYLPLEENTKDAMAGLLQRTSVRWTDSTIDDIEALNTQIERWFDDNLTSSIQNPSFEYDKDGNQLTTDGTYTNYVVPGWSVPTDVDEAFISNKNASGRDFADVEGNYVYNVWGGTPSNGFYVRQTISNLPEGFYKLTAVATTDPGNSISLQAGSTTQTTPFTVGRPNSQHLEVPLYYHNGEGDLIIGAFSNNWFEIDDFKLYRYDYYYDETIGTDEYATTAIRYNTDIPAGVEVYYVTSINPASGETGNKVRNTIHLEKYNGTQIAGGEGVILYKGGNEKARQFRFYRTDDEVDKISDNKLIGAVDRLEADDKQYGCAYYVLSKKTITYDKVVKTVNESTGDITTVTVETTEPVVGFYKLKEETAIPAHKAYLRVDEDNEFSVKNDYIFEFSNSADSEATGVANMHANQSEVIISIYSLSGARQNSLQPGVNILRMSDGSVRKVLVK